jgi:hypothetical protein
LLTTSIMKKQDAFHRRRDFHILSELNIISKTDTSFLAVYIYISLNYIISRWSSVLGFDVGSVECLISTNISLYYSKWCKILNIVGLMFVRFKLDVAEMTNNMHWLYHSFILYTASYMFCKWPAFIRELLRSFWVTLNTNRMCGISYNVLLHDLYGSGTTTLQHTGHVTTHYMIYHPFDLYFK